MSNKKLPENATKTEGAELARRGRGEISTATAVPHVSYDDLRHADRIVIDGLEVFANHGVYPEENALGQKFIVSLVLYADPVSYTHLRDAEALQRQRACLL